MAMKVKGLVKLGIVALMIVLISVLAINGCQYDKYVLQSIPRASTYGDKLSDSDVILFTVKDTGVDDYDKLLDETVSEMSGRLETYGYTDYSVSRQGTDTIRVEVAGAADIASLASNLHNKGAITIEDEDGHVIMDASGISEAYVGISQEDGAYVLAVNFTKEGSNIIADATESMRGEDMYVNMDGSSLFNVTVEDPITAGYCAITFTTSDRALAYESATRYANLINMGEIPLELSGYDYYTVSAEYGEGAADAIGIAGIIAIVAAALYFIIKYRLPGFAAFMSFMIYLLIFLYLYAEFAIVTGPMAIAAMLIGAIFAIWINIYTLNAYSMELASGRNEILAIRVAVKDMLIKALDVAVVLAVLACAAFIFGSGNAILPFGKTLILSIIINMLVALIVIRPLVKWAGQVAQAKN